MDTDRTLQPVYVCMRGEREDEWEELSVPVFIMTVYRCLPDIYYVYTNTLHELHVIT